SSDVCSSDLFKYFEKGILAGIMTIPLGMITSGIILGISLIDIVFNLIPVIIFSILIIIGLLRSPGKMISLFDMIGNVIIKISTLGLVLSIINLMYDIEILPGMLALEEGALIVFEIAITLSGALALFYLISTKLHKHIS